MTMLELVQLIEREEERNGGAADGLPAGEADTLGRIKVAST